MDCRAALLTQELFEEQSYQINYFYKNLDFFQTEEVLRICLECRGLLVLTGVGKSGIIAEKIAMTLVSTGTRALFLSSINLLHGDIGILTENDLVLMFSKSGETEELLKLIPHLRRKKSKIVAIVSDKKSRLPSKADLFVHLPMEKELCPFDLAPTTSTALQLLFGDVLAMALMRKKEFKIDQYASNHPSGTIGKKITKYVRDIMKTGEAIPFCGPDDLLADAIVALSSKKCGCIVIISSHYELLGIFTDGDLRRALKDFGPEIMKKTVTELMTSSPITVSPDDLAINALKIMQNTRHVMMAPVLENEKVIGLVHIHDIVQEEI